MVSWAGRLAHVAASTLLFVGLTFVLGHSILDGRLQGSDSALHLAYATWMDRFFPAIPHWYPDQGAGLSLLHGYPLLAHWTVVLVHRLTDLSLLQSFRLVSFASFPLAALAVYLFAWTVLRRQAPALLSGVFYLVAPVTWTWLYDWGFIAQQVGSVFLPLVLLAYDRTLEAQLDVKRSGRGRIWFSCLVVLAILGFLSHILTAAAAGAGIVLHGTLRTLTANRGERVHVLRSAAKIWLLLVVVAAAVSAVYLVPFSTYGQIANRSGLNIPPEHQLHRLSILSYFGLQPPDPQEILTRMQFPLVVSASAAGGILLAWILGRRDQSEALRALPWALSIVPATAVVLSPEIVAAILRLSWMAVVLVNFRSLLALAMVLQPMIGGFGLWALARALFVPEEWLRRTASARLAGRSLRETIAAGSAVAITFGLLFALRSPDSIEPWRMGYGPAPIDLRDLWGRRLDDSCNLPEGSPGVPQLCSLSLARATINLQELSMACAETAASGDDPPALCVLPSPNEEDVAGFLEDCRSAAEPAGPHQPCSARVDTPFSQLLLDPWPPVEIRDDDPSIEASRRVSSALPANRPLRLDVSPHLGRLAQDLATLAGASQLNSYTYQANLIHEMWGYQQNVFYSREEGVAESGSPQTLDELSLWFGTSTVLLNNEVDPVEMYATAGWELAFREGKIEIWHAPAAPSLASLTARSTVLVIGTPESDSYATLFRLATQGLMGYEEAILVEGEPTVEDNTLEDLQRFDAVILYGHDYRNSDAAWELLGEYVAQGGSLFVETGWEFRIPEWEFQEAPAVLPIGRLSWTDYGPSPEYSLDAPDIAGQIDLSLFKPLQWEGGPWRVSGADATDLRPGARMVLSGSGNPLVLAWDYGQGRVVWSGMNLVGHLRYQGENDEELRFLHNLLLWLLRGQADPYEVQPPVLRSHPDRIEILLTPTPGETNWLLWREAYYPNWRAEIADDSGLREAPIYRAGPGLMLIPVETSSSSALLMLTWSLSWVERAALVGSIAGACLLLALLVDGVFLGGGGFTRLRIAIQTKSPRPYLGESENVEWMEARRAEIAAGRRPLAESHAWPPGLGTPGTGPPDRPPSEPGPPRSSPDTEDLLRSMGRAHHPEGDWAKRVLGSLRAKGPGQSGTPSEGSRRRRRQPPTPRVDQ